MSPRAVETTAVDRRFTPVRGARASGFLRWSAAVASASLTYYAFVAARAQPTLWHSEGFDFAVQIMCFAIAAMFLGWSRGWALPRISDPGILFLLLTGAYLLYPTGVWLRGGLNLGEASRYAGVVLLAHGVFITVFMAAFVGVSGRRHWEPPRPDVRYLPSGRSLLLYPMLGLAIVAFLRIASSGTLLPLSNYGTAWSNLQSEISSSRATGGLGYLTDQILGKSYFYVILALGIGCGLAFARALQFRRGRLRLLFGVLTLVVLTLLMGVTTRSGALMVLAVAVLLADLLTGLIRWRYALVAIGLGFAIFVFFGYFRGVSSYGLAEGVSLSYQQFSQPGQLTGGDYEFKLMFQKDVVGAWMFDGQGEGLQLVLHSALSVVPSQLLPGKLDWPPTDNLLSLEMLGSAAVQGFGVAGSAIADGFRIGGLWGVGFSAALLGSLLGAAYRWLNSPGASTGGPQLLRVALAAGYFAWCFAFVRGDFALMLNVTFYVLILPWTVFRLALSGRARRAWLDPMPHPVPPAAVLVDGTKD
jgi:hypothetical protein